MQTNIKRKCAHAVVLNEEELRAISELLVTNYGELAISAECSEGSSLQTADLEEILAFENPNFRKIIAMAIGAGANHKERCTVTIREQSFTSCEIEISDGNDGRALKVADELTKRLKECKPFYSIFARITPTATVMILGLFWAMFTIWQAFLQTGKLATENPSLIFMFYLCLPIIALYFLSMSYIDRGWKWIFPKVWVSTGRQRQELDKRAKVRS